MTINETEPAADFASDGIQQIPATVPQAPPAPLPPAAAEARDQLLRAIGREAEQVVTTNPGHASAALVELASAYALVANGTPSGTVPVRVGSRSAEYGGATNPAYFS
ncbi:hypothetical protein [Nocardia sp. NPDC050175]|uniref:hypothetical protein n=1 Tax=Nocardia sp. NPDC050175 TaxID=3364317 RepID=UPI003798AE64